MGELSFCNRSRMNGLMRMRVWGHNVIERNWRLMLVFAALPILVLIGLWQGAPIVTITLQPDLMVPSGDRSYGYPVLGKVGRLYYLASDNDTYPRRSALTLAEDGHAFGLSHQTLDAVREVGGGRFVHWGEQLVFSSSDGSDPRSNGRTYVATCPAQPRAMLVGLLLLLGVGLAAPGGWRLLRPHLSDVLAGRLAMAALVVAVSAATANVMETSGGIARLFNDSYGYTYANPARTPGYFWLLSLWNWLGDVGELIVPVQLGMILAGIIVLGRSLGAALGRPVVGTVAAAIMVLDTMVLRLSAFVLTEAVFLTALCVHVGMILRLCRGFSWIAALMAGISLGLVMIVRPVGLFLVLPFAIVWFRFGGARLRMLVAVVVPSAALFAAAVIANAVTFGFAAPHKFGGLALFGHVVHLASEEDARTNADLAAIRARIEPLTAGLSEASFPSEYRRKALLAYNAALWGQVVPEMVKRHDISEKGTAGIVILDDMLFSMAKKIIINHPLGYMRLVLSQIYGMWDDLFAFAFWKSQIVEEYDMSTTVASNITRGNLIWENLAAKVSLMERKNLEQMRTAKRPLIEELWYHVCSRGILKWLAAAATMMMAALVLRRRPNCAELAMSYLGVVIWAYMGAVAAAQPAMFRYSLIVEPSVIAALIGGGLLLVRYLGRVSAAEIH